MDNSPVRPFYGKLLIDRTSLTTFQARYQCDINHFGSAYQNAINLECFRQFVKTCPSEALSVASTEFWSSCRDLDPLHTMRQDIYYDPRENKYAVSYYLTEEEQFCLGTLYQDWPNRPPDLSLERYFFDQTFQWAADAAGLDPTFA